MASNQARFIPSGIAKRGSDFVFRVNQDPAFTELYHIRPFKQQLSLILSAISKQ